MAAIERSQGKPPTSFNVYALTEGPRSNWNPVMIGMVVLGGLGSVPGVVAGAIVLSVVNNYLLPDVLFEAHRLRLARGDYNIADVHLADAIETLVARSRPTLSADRSPKSPY